MKFTDADLTKNLVKAMGLKVDDRIKCKGRIYILNNNYMLHNEESGGNIDILYLINEEFEILSPKKKVGELRCCDIACENCPLNIFQCYSGNSEHSLYEKIESSKLHQDQEIYDIIKKRLDKEVD